MDKKTFRNEKKKNEEEAAAVREDTKHIRVELDNDTSLVVLMVMSCSIDLFERMVERPNKRSKNYKMKLHSIFCQKFCMQSSTKTNTPQERALGGIHSSMKQNTRR